MSEQVAEALVGPVLAGMLRRFDGGRGWCQHHEALTVNGLQLSATDHRAAKWCLMGAMIVEAWDLSETMEVRQDLQGLVMERLEKAAGVDQLANVGLLENWNDEQESFGPVKALLEAALEDGK